MIRVEGYSEYGVLKAKWSPASEAQLVSQMFEDYPNGIDVYAINWQVYEHGEIQGGYGTFRAIRENRELKGFSFLLRDGALGQVNSRAELLEVLTR